MEGSGDLTSSSEKTVSDNQLKANCEKEPNVTSPGNEDVEIDFSDEDEIGQHGSCSSSRAIRHTPQQIEELENCRFFKINPEPNVKEKREIGRKLNMGLDKVRIWFQNKRSQIKSHKGRYENELLKKENEKLWGDNLALQYALNNPTCAKCCKQVARPDTSIQKHKLLMENAQLKAEPSSLTKQVKPLMLPEEIAGIRNYDSLNLVETQSQRSINMLKQWNVYLQSALIAMEELMKLGNNNIHSPLWYTKLDILGETLNYGEYIGAFRPCLGRKPDGFESDATRANAMVEMSSSALVEALLYANQWREMFRTIVRSCSVLEVISNGIDDSRNGALQLMKAEIQLVSSLVPVRVVKFLRFVKQQSERVWAVVDLSIEGGMDRFITRRCPTGCILYDMGNGSTMVTWIEHDEYNDHLVPDLYRGLIRSGIGFGATRWLSALLRHCEGLKFTSISKHCNMLPAARRSLKALAQRMTNIFCAGVCQTGDQQWTLVTNVLGGPRIMTRMCDVSGLGQPSGTIATATYSFWTPARHGNLFELLLRRQTRFLWDVMCHEHATQTLINFPLAHEENSPNCISILNSNPPIQGNSISVLQETWSDMTESLIVFAPVDSPTVSSVMNGNDSDNVALLPIGLCIVPDFGEGCEQGSLVTMSIHMLLPDLTTNPISTANDLVSRTVVGINEIVTQQITSSEWLHPVS